MTHDQKIENGVDPNSLRTALGCYPTGICIITCQDNDGIDYGMTISSVNSLSLSPPLKLFSIKKTARSLPVWEAAKGLVINVLAENQSWLSDRFARANEDRWADVKFARGLANAPILEEVVAAFECELHTTISTGDHILFIVDVVRASAHSERNPLLFHNSGYRSVNAQKPA